MDDLFAWIRVIHILSGALWIGEVVTINFVLIPSASRLRGDARNQFLATVFPKIFRLASVLSFTVVVTGVLLVYHLTNGSFDLLSRGRWGVSILVGGSLGILLTCFHFFLENRLAKKIGPGRQGDDQQFEYVHMKLKLVPRVGLIVITTIFLLMVNATRELF